MTPIYGPDFLVIQLRDLERSADSISVSLESNAGDDSPPAVIAFDTSSLPFAVREPPPGTDLEAGPSGLGVSPSLRADDAQAVYDQLRVTVSRPSPTRSTRRLQDIRLSGSRRLRGCRARRNLSVRIAAW